MSLRTFLKPIVYARLEPELLSLREVGSGRTLSEPPLAALSGQKVLAVGEAARLQGGEVVNPFRHPRTLLAEFTVAQAVLKGFLKKLYEGRWFQPAPLIVLHARVDLEGGLTQIERRALHELGMGAGAYRVLLWQGRDLMDDEMLAADFKGI